MPRLLICGSLVGCCVILSGCATLQLLSLGASSISYAVTGKSLSDHAISEVLDQDCALHRVALGEQACNAFETAGILRPAKSNQEIPMLTVNERYWQDDPMNPLPQKPLAQMSINPERQIQPFSAEQSPDEVVIGLMAEQHHQKRETISAANDLSDTLTPLPIAELYAEVGATEKPQLFAVLGSYNDFNYAKESLQEFPTLNAKVINNPDRMSNSSATRYRVVAGPISESEFAEQLEPKFDVWRLQLCSDSYTRPPCVSPMLAQHAK